MPKAQGYLRRGGEKMLSPRGLACLLRDNLCLLHMIGKLPHEISMIQFPKQVLENDNTNSQCRWAIAHNPPLQDEELQVIHDC